jgi:hypothetical protein
LKDGKPYAALGILAISLGAFLAALNLLGWYYTQTTLALYAQAPLFALVSRFFILLGLATTMVLIGGYVNCRALVAVRTSSESPSVASIVSAALSSRKALKVGVLCGIAYGVVYAFASSILVYQPGVDFSSVYGVSTMGSSVVACCGGIGTVPTLVVYILPQAHLALQIVPLSLMFLVIVPFLVSVNMAVVAYALNISQVRITGGWIGSIGMLVGLFTGCPTCAGAFLASAVGGVGGTALSVALAPYQLLFILVSIPLLVASPAVVVACLKRSMSAACRLPDSKNL